jgi:two-component system chemotaxis response regulator CheV
VKVSDSETAELSGLEFDVLEFSLPKKKSVKPSRFAAKIEMPSTDAAADVRFCIPVSLVREVIRLPLLDALPAGSPGFLGVFQWRQAAVPALSLSAVWGLGQRIDPEQGRIVVVDAYGSFYGLVVSGVRKIRRISTEDIMPPQVSLYSGVRGLILDENRRFVFLLDIEKALAESSFPDGDFRKKVATASLPDSTQSSFFGAHRPVVVVVDESATARARTIEFLLPYPFDVVESASASEALRECQKLWQQKKDFLVVSETDLPDLDGFSFVSQLRSYDEFSDIPIFLHANFTSDFERRRVRTAGADAAISKFNRSQLQTVMSVYLDILSSKREVRKIS